jgi:hypothetical protein
MTTSRSRIRDASQAEELWTWAHIARHVHRGRTATFQLVASPGFPAPVSLANGADRLWLADEVRAYVRSLARVPRLAPTPAPIAVDQPFVMAVRAPRRRHAKARGAA